MYHIRFAYFLMLAKELVAINTLEMYAIFSNGIPVLLRDLYAL